MPGPSFFHYQPMHKRHLALAVVLALATLEGPRARADEAVRATHEAVIAGHPLATQVGLDVLHAGGTAADALVAVSLALNVTEPGNSGLGGKMVLLYYDAKTQTVSGVTAMAAAPLAMDDAKLASLPVTGRTSGWTAVCTPGLAAGLGAAHRKWGTMPWADLVERAAKLADDGFTLSPAAAGLLLDFHPGVNDSADAIYAPDHKHSLPAGATLRNRDLGHTLHLLAAGGPASFYRGEIARKLVAGDNAGGGCMTLADLARYKAREIDPLKVSYEGYTVYSSAPPLNGGTTLLTSLECLAGHDWHGVAPRSPVFVDALARVLEQVYPQVGPAAGDTPDSRQRVEKVLSPQNVAQLTAAAKAADPAHPFPRKGRSATTEAAGVSREPSLAMEFGSTTHLIIVDKMGDIACCTQSLGLHFGACVVAPGTGFLLNADVDNFSPPGATGVDAIAPGKWPGSTMSPTIFLRDGKPVLAIGSPASARIPTAVLQVSLDILDFGRPLAEAIRTPRFHLHTLTKGKPNVLELETTVPADYDATLSKMGWDVQRIPPEKATYWGSVNAVQFGPDGLTAVADQRRTSDAGGD
jgi:gamma-glutamyltranspeptidase/glutathione hydrolase